AAPVPAAASPPPPTEPPRRRPPQRGGRPTGAIALALVLLGLAGAGVLAAVLSSGGDGDGSQQADRGNQQQGDRNRAERNTEQQQQQQAEQQQAEPAEPAPAPAPEAEEEPPAEQPSGGGDPATGAELNDQGYALMQQGDYAGAVPILQEAVASWPEDSTDITYAYALFNLGKSLNRSGNPEAAIPYLEKRLRWDDQRATVQAELDLAKRNAGQG
ncbi:MAG TPA: tetratricopeptide repeat protein, partial [Thermoleophilaceae bacterium]|nr:tetratricopeptide repeat protein [Thermoleophilaceae bacterium]